MIAYYFYSYYFNQWHLHWFSLREYISAVVYLKLKLEDDENDYVQ